jgi:hypothetical protein
MGISTLQIPAHARRCQGALTRVRYLEVEMVPVGPELATGHPEGARRRDEGWSAHRCRARRTSVSSKARAPCRRHLVLGQLHAALVRLFAHARLVAVGVAAARAMPGRRRAHGRRRSGPMPPFVDTPPERLVAALRPMLRPCHPPMLPRLVRFVGRRSPSLAESRYAAEDAAAVVNSTSIPARDRERRHGAGAGCPHRSRGMGGQRRGPIHRPKG